MLIKTTEDNQNTSRSKSYEAKKNITLTKQKIYKQIDYMTDQ